MQGRQFADYSQGSRSAGILWTNFHIAVMAGDIGVVGVAVLQAVHRVW
jgi:hypothetical protein